jgi:CheY-like chemotaxis protein
MSTPKDILIIDDNSDHGYLAKHFINRRWKDCFLSITHNWHSAEEALRFMSFDAVLLDYSLSDMTGEDIFLLIREVNPRIPVVLFSASVPDDRIPVLFQMGVLGVVRKHPSTYDILPDLLIRAIARAEALDWCIRHHGWIGVPLAIIPGNGVDSQTALVDRDCTILAASKEIHDEYERRQGDPWCSIVHERRLSCEICPMKQCCQGGGICFRRVLSPQMRTGYYLWIHPIPRTGGAVEKFIVCRSNCVGTDSEELVLI